MQGGLIRELLRKYAAQILFLLGIAVTSVLVGLFTIDMGRRIINVLSSPASGPQGNLHLLFTYCSFILLAVVVGGAINYLLNIHYARFSQSLLGDIRLRLFQHLIRLPQDFYNKNPTGQIISRMMNEVGYIGNFFSRLFLLPVMNLVMVVFYGVYIFFLNWKMAIAGTIFIPICILIVPKFNRRIVLLTEEYIDSTGRISSYFQEAFSGIGDIRFSQTYGFEQSKLKKRIGEFFAVNVNLAKCSGGLESITKVITQLAPLLVYLYGGILCLRGELTVGALIAAIAVINNLYGPVNSLVFFVQEWRQVKVRFDKLDEYLNVTPESGILPAIGNTRMPLASVEFDKVQFGFAPDETLLTDISFSAEHGKKAAFVGTSGSGKSLTATLISRIYRQLSGRIVIGGQDIDSIPLRDLRSEIGYVGQTPFLFDDTIKRNILYSLLRKDGGESDRIEEWVDFSSLDAVDDWDTLEREIVRIVRDVGLFDDIYSLGLRAKQGAQARKVTDADKGRILQARKMFLREMADRDSRYVEQYREDAFLEYCTLFENIVFCPSSVIHDEFGSIEKFCASPLNELLGRNGLVERFFTIGLHLASADNHLLERLYKGRSPLLGHLGLPAEQIGSKVKINERLAIGGEAVVRMEQVDPALAAEILGLAYSHVPGTAKEELLDDALREEILGLRKTFMAHPPWKAGGKIGFFHPGEYLESLSLMENIVFGNIDPLRNKANEVITDAVRKILAEVGLEDLVVQSGLEFTVGDRGSRLSGGQRQKVAIARILLKNPSILILDEATASLDAASQARITELIGERFRGKTVISIAHRLTTIKDYHEILVFDKGRIVEQGSFEQLLQKDGLFRKLYAGSN